jgi:hypothetical protein
MDNVLPSCEYPPASFGFVPSVFSSCISVIPFLPWLIRDGAFVRRPVSGRPAVAQIRSTTF